MTEIWTFGGGKGGVGKSIISANVALNLAHRNAEVIIIDADLGAANIHTCLGMSAPRKSLVDFLSHSVPNLADCICHTPYDKLRLISGAQDSLKVSNPTYEQLVKLLEGIKKLNADYIIIDLGAGTVIHTIDLFIQGHKGILVTMPEPTAIENTYRFIKYAIYRKFRSIINHPGVRAHLEKVMINREKSHSTTPLELIQEIQEINYDAGQRILQEIRAISFNLIMNQVRSNNDVKLGFTVSKFCLKYFGININYVGFVESDKEILQSARIRKPVLLTEPYSKSSRSVRRIVDNFLKNEKLKNVTM